MEQITDSPGLSIEEIRCRVLTGSSVKCKLDTSSHRGEGPDIYLLLDASDGMVIVDQLENCIQYLDQHSLDLLLVVRDRKLPVYSKRVDNTIRSCLTTLREAFFSEQSVFGVTQAGMLGGYRIGATSVPFSSDSPSWEDAQSTAFSWIIPHAGPLELLVQTLRHVKNEMGEHDEVLVGFDEPVTEQHIHIRQMFPWASFYRAQPYGRGPYGVRHELAAKASLKHFLFQDSDDLPLQGRVSQISRLLHSETGIAGSQCVYMDEIQNDIYVVRFPIDVNSAMRDNASHSILFPSTGVTADYYQASGGLSTFVRHSLDSQFIIRSVLRTRIRNSQHFCYLKRVRFGALTTDPATALGTVGRMELLSQWKKEFARVQRGEEPRTASLHPRRDSTIELVAI